MTRTDCVNGIMDQVKKNDIVITTAGYISRQVYQYKDRDLNFYMMGSMGCAFALGLGIALNVKNRVFVINGDGSALMGLGSLVTGRKYNLSNLVHIIIDNNCHESTGGQVTASEHVDFRSIYYNTICYKVDKDLHIPDRIPLKPKQITERFMNAIKHCNNK